MNIYTILSSVSHNSHYLNRYWKFVQSYKNQQKITGITECHHICPKSNDLFPMYKSLYKFPWNGVHLTYRQHCIAHWLLYKTYGGSQIYAYMMIYHTRTNDKTQIKISSCVLKKFSYNNSRNRSGENNAFFNKKHSIETREKLSKYKGELHHGYKIPLTDAHKAKLGDSKATVWYYVTTPDNICIKVRNLSKYCRDNNIHPSAMIRVAKNLQEFHKGYKCTYA